MRHAAVLVAQSLADHILPVTDDKDDLIKQPVKLIQAVLDQRAVQDGQQRLWPCQSEGKSASALSGDHQNSLHNLLQSVKFHVPWPDQANITIYFIRALFTSFFPRFALKRPTQEKRVDFYYVIY